MGLIYLRSCLPALLAPLQNSARDSTSSRATQTAHNNPYSSSTIFIPLLLPTFNPNRLCRTHRKQMKIQKMPKSNFKLLRSFLMMRKSLMAQAQE